MENTIFQLGLLWKSPYQQIILPVSHEEKMIDDI